MLVDDVTLSGFLWGLLATLVMSLVMVTATVLELAPMPIPIPVAIVNKIIPGFSGMGLTQGLLGAIAHFLYGGVAGAVFGWFLNDRVSILRGLGWGAFLWLIMQVLVLPFLGWGFFGLAITGVPPKIAVGTLVLHLIYGGVLGWGLVGSKGIAVADAVPDDTVD